MNIAAILREIDSEIDRLERARAILSEVAAPAPLKQRRQLDKLVVDRPLVVPQAAIAPPKLIVVPPKTKRGYRRTHKPLPTVPRPLSSAIPLTPVFVSRTAVPIESGRLTALMESDTETLESTMRKNLLGGVA
jgi:hypothetical protein